MIKPKVLALLFAGPLAIGGFAQSSSPIDLTALNSDVTTLFTSIGQDLGPHLHELAISGNELVGEADLRGPLGMSITLAGLSLETMDGFAKVLGTNSSDVWKFSLLSIPSLVQSNIASSGGTVASGYTMATTSAMPWPAMRLGFGVSLPAGFEVLGSGFYFSTSLINAALGATGISLPLNLNSLGANLDLLSAGGLVRKSILSDRKGFFRPSISIGASYNWSSFDFTVDKFSLDALGVTAPELSGLGTLSMSGNLGFHSHVQTFGAIFHVSKTLLWVLTPYAKVGAYYHLTDYSSNFDVTAVVTPTDPAATPISQSLSAPVTIHSEDASLVLSGGLEVKILVAVLTLGASLDLERPVVQLPSLANLDPAALMAGTKLNGLGLTLALRMQI